MGKYLHCIVKGKVHPSKINTKGLDGKDISVITQGGLSCLMSDTFCDHYPLWREHIIAHQRPIEQAMKHYDVLPFSFSNIANTEDQVREKILKERKNELEELFQKFKGKTEVGVKAFWPDMQSVFKEIAKNSSELQRLKRIRRLPYQKQIAVGELVGKLLEKKKNDLSREIIDSLGVSANDCKESELIGENMMINAAFLIDKGKEIEFSRKIKELTQDHKDVKFNFSGPFPLYNFISLDIHLA
ncbi:GvpL/GvpF family gas vesicle protein [Candidatus Parcubacteria bacterium]|nr:GvpL/GvpF family gas vesicle protein [Candidatus Parcubacteria bacterium]